LQRGRTEFTFRSQKALNADVNWEIPTSFAVAGYDRPLRR
jgi:hypothetical protein